MTTGGKSVPKIYLKGKFFGGINKLLKADRNNLRFQIYNFTNSWSIYLSIYWLYETVRMEIKINISRILFKLSFIIFFRNNSYSYTMFFSLMNDLVTTAGPAGIWYNLHTMLCNACTLMNSFDLTFN